MPIHVNTDFDLNEDQKHRVLGLFRGNGHFDYQDKFKDASGACRECVGVHFLKEPKPGIPGGDSTIDGIDDLRFDRSPSLYLEDASGALTGWKLAREWTPSSWNFGVIFKDDEGQAWFCGRQSGETKTMDAEAPILRRVSLETPDHVIEQYGPVTDNLPAEGEFWLSHEEIAVVTSIPWWSYISDETLKVPEIAEHDNAALERMKERVRALAADSAEPAPSPA